MFLNLCLLFTLIYGCHAQVNLPGSTNLNGLSSGTSSGITGTDGSITGLSAFPDVSGTGSSTPGANIGIPNGIGQPGASVDIMNPSVLGSQPGGLQDEMPGPLTLTGGVNTDELANDEQLEEHFIDEGVNNNEEQELQQTQIEEEKEEPQPQLFGEEEAMQEAISEAMDEGVCVAEISACENIASCEHVLEKSSACDIPKDIIQGAENCWVKSGFTLGTAQFQAFSDVVLCLSDHSFESLDDASLNVCANGFFCAEIFIPVCGTDGILPKTFDNQCFLDQAICRDPNISLLHKDECTDEDLNGIDVCGDSTFCMAIFDPVCAFTDGGVETFPSACQLRMAQCDDPNLSLKHTGECTDEDGDSGASADIMNTIEHNPWILVAVLIGLIVLAVGGGIIFRKIYNARTAKNPPQTYANLTDEGAEMVAVDFD